LNRGAGLAFVVNPIKHMTLLSPSVPASRKIAAPICRISVSLAAMVLRMR
jgi:hypothetical protein